VAIEAMERKMNDLQDAIKKDPPDIKLLQLLLQGSISTQVCIEYSIPYTMKVSLKKSLAVCVSRKGTRKKVRGASKFY